MPAPDRTGPNPVLLTAGFLATLAAMAGRMGWFDGVPWDSVALAALLLLYLFIFLLACAAPIVGIGLAVWVLAREAVGFWRRRRSGMPVRPGKPGR